MGRSLGHRLHICAGRRHICLAQQVRVCTTVQYSIRLLGHASMHAALPPVLPSAGACCAVSCLPYVLQWPAHRCRNKHFTTLYNTDYLNDPAHCPAHPHDRKLLADEGKEFNPQYFLEASGLCLGVSAVGSVLLGLLLLALFKHRPHGTVGFCAGLQVTALTDAVNA